MHSKNIISVTFARGGSKGLPGKNLLPLNGIPLLGHAINCTSEIISKDRIFVSTEDPEIAECAEKYGARVIKRPAELASDNSPEWKSWQHACLAVTDMDIDFDHLLSVPCTSPMKNSHDLSNCVAALLNNPASDACITVTHSNRNPYFNMVRLLPSGLCEVLMSNASTFSRRQDTPEVFDITTVAYAANKTFIMKSNNIFEGEVCYSLVPKERSLDIDDSHDFDIAKALLEGNFLNA